MVFEGNDSSLAASCSQGPFFLVLLKASLPSFSTKQCLKNPIMYHAIDTGSPTNTRFAEKLLLLWPSAATGASHLHRGNTQHGFRAENERKTVINLRRYKAYTVILCWLCVIACAGNCHAAGPNIVYILADDLGLGDVRS